MKTRHGLVSNSSSTSFMIHTKDIKDEELYSRLICFINTEGNYIEPQLKDKNLLYVSTGMSSGNECLFRWWGLKKFLVCEKIKHTEEGGGCPDIDQKVCDFVNYIVDKNNEQKVQEFKDWYYRNVSCRRIEDALKAIGLTKEDIKKDLDHGNPDMVEMYADLIKE